MSNVIPFVLIAGVLAAIVGYSLYYGKKRKDEAVRVAAERGYEVRLDDHGLPHQQFDLFQRGDGSRHAKFKLNRPGSDEFVFEFTYTTETTDADGDRSSTSHQMMCAVVRVPFSAPSTTIGKEGFFSKLARSAGRRDIEVESPEFNAAYKVNSHDERFAIAVLDPPTINAFIQEHRRGNKLELEFSGSWMVAHRSGIFSAGEMIDFLEWTQQIPPMLPAVLGSLYPTQPGADRGQPGPGRR